MSCYHQVASMTRRHVSNPPVDLGTVRLLMEVNEMVVETQRRYIQRVHLRRNL